MKICKNISIILGCYLLLTGCKLAGKNTSDKQQSSSLKTVHDDQYLLKLSKINDSSSQYHFVTCLKDSNHCVAAFENARGQTVTFSLEPLSELQLTDKDRAALKENHQVWMEYQSQLAKKSTDVVAGSAITGGLVIGGFFADNNLAQKVDHKNMCRISC